MALSGDGRTLAVSALQEDSSAVGIGGSQADNSVSDAGALYVFERDVEDVWSQQAYIKASNTNAVDQFGWSVALSEDGNTLAVGAWLEDSSAMGIGGNQADNSGLNAGAVYVFERDVEDVWSQQAYIKASNTDANDYFGYSVALSGDGDTLAVGAHAEGSSAVGVGGDQADNSTPNSGAVYVFERDGQNAWSQQAYIKASNTGVSDVFGYSVALSGDGITLAVGAFGEDSNTMGIGGSQADNSTPDAGAVYVFERDFLNIWSQQAYIKASNTGANDQFGYSVALSGDASTLAVGAYGEDSSAMGIGGNQADDSTSNTGATYMFERDGQNEWSQQAYIKASNSGAFDSFGYSVALSEDGSTLAVGAYWEGSGAMGIGGDQLDNSASFAGSVYMFERDGQNAWSQQAYVKASATDADDWFGWAAALSGDGNTLAVGARFEGSSAMGVGGDQLDNSASEAGAVYLY